MEVRMYELWRERGTSQKDGEGEGRERRGVKAWWEMFGSIAAVCRSCRLATTPPTQLQTQLMSLSSDDKL